jgi:hypothetical protein
MGPKGGGILRLGARKLREPQDHRGRRPVKDFKRRLIHPPRLTSRVVSKAKGHPRADVLLPAAPPALTALTAVDRLPVGEQDGAGEER